jgi:hypothetical protein
MAFYELIVEADRVSAPTIREVRKHSRLGVTEIIRLIRAREPVVTVSTTDYPLELDMQEGRRRQHAAVLGAHEALSGLGNRVTIRYRPSLGRRGEVVDLQVAKNLMDTELADLRQEHD